MSRYGTLMVDPPWAYEGAGPPGSNSSTGTHFNLDGSLNKTVSAARVYPLMATPDLCALPVAPLAEENAHLYLWFTNAFAAEAHQLALAWDFKPKTILTWAKVKKGRGLFAMDGEHVEGAEPSMKTGFYFRGASEHILFCVRGSLRTTQQPPRPTVFFLPREAHSVKPQFFYDLAREQSPGAYVELFARTRRPGWDAWGNEVESNVEVK